MNITSGKHLTFLLANEEYGIPIQKVKEIIGLMPITKVPKMPIYIKGVLNLRGKIIPVMDLRLRFDMTEVDYHSRTCIIVIEVIEKDKKKFMGIIVDTVSEVLFVNEKDIELPPEIELKKDDGFLNGMGKVKDKEKEKVILLLDIDKVLNIESIIVTE